MTDRSVQTWLDALSGGNLGQVRMPAAEQLALWMGWTDALTLASIIDAPGDATTATTATVVTPAAAAAHALAATASSLLASGRERLESQLHGVVDDLLADWARDPDPSVVRRGIARAQRLMEEGVSRLRAQLRRLLVEAAPHDPALEQLAQIDAVLEQALADRQRSLLSGASGRLGRLSENPAEMATPAALLHPLVAELDLRWRALVGLNQALQSRLTLPA